MTRKIVLATILITTAILAREPIPSGEFVIGEVLEKDKSSVKIEVKEPRYCEGTVTYLVKEGIEVPPKGTKIIAHFAKGYFCDDEQPVIERIEVFRDEKI